MFRRVQTVRRSDEGWVRRSEASMRMGVLLSELLVVVDGGFREAEG